MGLKRVGVLLKLDKPVSLIEDKVGDICNMPVDSWESAHVRANVILVDGVGRSYGVMQVA